MGVSREEVWQTADNPRHVLRLSRVRPNGRKYLLLVCAIVRHVLPGKRSEVGLRVLDELERFYDLELAHEDVDSISGLILTLLGRPPQVGDSVQYERLKFEVTAVKGHGVDEAAVSPVS